MLPYIISPACIFLCLYRCLSLPFPISSFYSANASLNPCQYLPLPPPMPFLFPFNVFLYPCQYLLLPLPMSSVKQKNACFLCYFGIKHYLCTRIYAQMAESVDALVSNTSGAIRPGSTPGLGTLLHYKSLVNH